ncbi:MAG TPA: type II toxin-antitoxin system VapC family toxin [Candidatus Limnocylindrales bacterium]
MIAAAARGATVLVDSNVLLDVATNDPAWFAWSSEALETAADAAVLAINSIIYAEISIGFSRVEDLEEVVPAQSFRRESLPYAAAFLAGKAFLRYRRRGGERATPLPDFYIGAHAAVAGFRLLTRDPRRYRAYFPTVELISPP